MSAVRGLSLGGGRRDWSLQASSFLPTGRWVHVAVTLQGSTRLYVDGSEVAQEGHLIAARALSAAEIAALMQ